MAKLPHILAIVQVSTFSNSFLQVLPSLQNQLSPFCQGNIVTSDGHFDVECDRHGETLMATGKSRITSEYFENSFPGQTHLDQLPDAAHTTSS